jgi:two-component system NtrC family response regulator
MDKPKLLIVDDDETIRTQMKWALLEEYEIFLAGDREEALRIVQAEHPPLATLDLGLPPAPHTPEEGFATLREILHEDGAAKVLIVTGNTDRGHAMRAVSEGAHDFFSKPIDPDELRITLKRALQLHRIETENRELQQRLAQQAFPEIIGGSAVMEEVFSTVQKVATTDVPVLITGETGTGKELVARAIHRLSDRRNGPFTAINCAAIPETLLESELFGHEKGAFTGADAQRIGRFEKASGGTLFLDEIGDLGSGLQAKLLRFLQEHTIERIGGHQTIELDVRVVAATNRDLHEEVRQGRFREDLYFRLAVVTIRLPPVRNRGEDVTVIATSLLNRYARELTRPIKGFSPEALQAIRAYTWPGNVREMENRIRRAVIMANEPMLQPRHLEIPEPHGMPNPMTLKEAKDRIEKEMVARALRQTRWNVSLAAKELGISRQALHDIITKHGLKQ